MRAMTHSHVGHDSLIDTSQLEYNVPHSCAVQIADQHAHGDMAGKQQSRHHQCASRPGFITREGERGEARGRACNVRQTESEMV